MQIRSIEHTTIEDQQSNTALKISLKSRQLTLQCESASEADDWHAALQASREANKPKKAPALPSTPEHPKLKQMPASIFDTDRSPADKAQLSPQASTTPRSPSTPASAPLQVSVLAEEGAKKASAGVLSPHAKGSKAVVMPPPPTFAASSMSIAYTRAWDNFENAYYFYTDSESFWELPQVHPGGEWVLVWDLIMEAPIYFHTGTHAESAVSEGSDQLYSHLPTGEYQQHGLEENADEPINEEIVWLEAWDDTYETPYYVHVLSGVSQWEWPVDGYVVQYGSEDYDHWWSQGQRAFEFDGSADEESAEHTTTVVTTAPGDSAAAAAAGADMPAADDDTPTSMTSMDKRLMAEAFGGVQAGADSNGDTKVQQHLAVSTPHEPPTRPTGERKSGSLAAMQLRRQASGKTASSNA